MKSIHNVYSTHERVPFHNLEDATISHRKEESMNEDYSILIEKPFDITIRYGHPRSKQYALDTLQYLWTQGDLCYGFIEDGPDFSMRGIIEGFYGAPWTHEDRLDALSFLQQERMNTFIYAPKDDPYHRKLWRKPYPKTEFNQLKELIDKASELNIDFYFTISPGNDFHYTKEEDFNALFNKIDTITALGVNTISILLDDINYQLDDTDQAKFNSPGQAHAYICNTLHNHLKDTLDSHKLIMCPTEYWQLEDSQYHKDLRDDLDSSIAVFWTGLRVVPEYIPNRDGKRAKNLFQHDLVLWENYPVNDFAPNHLYMGPLVNRGDRLHHTHIGMVANPMIEWAPSKLPLMTIADYMWNASTYDPETSYHNAIASIAKEDDNIEPLTVVLDMFRPSIISGDHNAYLMESMKRQDVTTIHTYYKQLNHNIDLLSNFLDPRLYEQMTPWFDRLRYDLSLLEMYIDGETEPLQTELETVHDKKHDTMYNYVLLLFQELGLYTILKKTRKLTNKWEFIDTKMMSD